MKPIKPIKVLHIIQQLSRGGAARSMIAIAKYSSRLGHFQQSVISLRSCEYSVVLQLAQEAGMTVVNDPDKSQIDREIEAADIVQIHFWNSPELYHLLTSELPPCRLLIWFHIAGDHPPQIITKELVDYADFAIPCNPYSSELPVFHNLPPEVRLEKIGMVYDATDFARIENIQLKPHDTFNVGYIGTVYFAKMHRNYVSMSASIDIPNVQFIVCGHGGIEEHLEKQAKELGALERFDFRGYVEDIQSVIEILDVYGYPLCEDTYAAAELVLQEVMYAGIPPVVFPYGGVKRLVVDNFTGLIVHSELEYKQAIEYLYHHPEERQRLGRNAREYARQIFGAENAAKQLNPIYDRLLSFPKKTRKWPEAGEVSETGFLNKDFSGEAKTVAETRFLGGDAKAVPETGLLFQPISIDDLIGNPSQPSGAELFIQSLGDSAPQFKTSFTSQDIQELFAAERKISESSLLLYTFGSGGFLHYQAFYPNDAYLRLWAGLLRQQQGQYTEAISLFQSAINFGCNHWRVSWYVAQIAEKVNDIQLAENCLKIVLQSVPDFEAAQAMSARIKSLSQTFPERTQIEPNKITNFHQTRQQLAQQWMRTSDAQLEKTYLIHLVKLHYTIMNSPIKYEPISEAEQDFVNNLVAKISEGLDQPQGIQALLAVMLYLRADQLPLGWYKNAPIPKWLFNDFILFLIDHPEFFKNIGEATHYAEYMQDLVDYLHQRIFSNPDSETWQKIAKGFNQHINLIPLYFNEANLKNLIIKVSEITEFALSQEYQLDYSFPDPPPAPLKKGGVRGLNVLLDRPNRPKIRLGILKDNFRASTETFATLPVFEHLNRDHFEIILYATEFNNQGIEQYCQSRADKLVKLSGNITEQVRSIRGDDLDILFIGMNSVTRLRERGLLESHRLARVQVTSFCSPITTRMRHIDYYIAGELTAPTPTYQEQYRERLVNVSGSGICFRFPVVPPPATVKPTRQSWGATSESVVFISGANFHKIIPELRETWAKIIAAVPNSILVLYPFGPAWSPSYLAIPFINQMRGLFSKYGINPNRLAIINTLPSPADIKECLKIADVYLDSYPYAGATSLIDPLEVGLPPVVWEGNTLRSRQGSAMLRELQMPELIANSEETYINLAVTLGNNSQLRQQHRQQIQQQMQNNPPFLDSRTYSAKIGNLFQQLVGAVLPCPPNSDPDNMVGAVDGGCPNKEFINRAIGCVNLYYIDPSEQAIAEELRQIRRQLADFWLNTATEQLQQFYQSDLGQAYEKLVTSEIKKEPLTADEDTFVQHLARELSLGFKSPKAINYLLAARLYRPVQVPANTQGIPDWLVLA
jgi:predicted O-linked N-acetylglucosamine transferase (SPINDLY family)/glycosyltransferase involved in cell wall biosynthesis